MTEPATQLFTQDLPDNSYFSTSLQHLLAEVERVDLLIQLLVWRGRQVQETNEEFQGLYITEEEVNSILAHPAGLPRWATAPASVSREQVDAALRQMAREIDQRKTVSQRRGVRLRLEELSQTFGLTPFDVDALLICLAPEIDGRYDRLYAYLHDDVTRKRPSVDLVLNLLCPSLESKLESRRRFGASSPLVRHRLLQFFADPSQQQPTLLGKYLKVDERIAGYLLDSDEVDSRVEPYCRLTSPESSLDHLVLPWEVKARLGKLVQHHLGNRSRFTLYFQGPYGVGKQTTAEGVCRELGLELLVVNTERLLTEGEAHFPDTVGLAVREALLQNAALYWQEFDLLLEESRQPLLQMLLRELEAWPGLTFLAGSTQWEPSDAMRQVPFVRIEFPKPDPSQREQLWARNLNGSAQDLDPSDLQALTAKFRFSGGQIRDAAATAQNLALWRDPEKGNPTVADLYAASRAQSNRKLATLAQKIVPHYQWDDIVLPPDRLQQLREICNYVKYNPLVYHQWGFDKKLAMGKGLNALFAGPSGTGKTMAADIIAGELGLDLYKIDLSGVVSKYIGETEKNLSRIFTEAETSNAILFFDEADALFGKRSEVRDSHDRYANIEISYLLQRMEEYDGVVILATNLRKNLDDAFVRRMHFTVDFPYPGDRERRQIWDRIWPPDMPRSPQLDLGFMAQRFELAGGNIRNIALAAAFLAAADGGVVAMPHLIHATRREYQKMGKLIAEGEFGEYAASSRPATK